MQVAVIQLHSVFGISRLGPVAQRSEQWTHNPLVVGSNPTGPSGLLNVMAISTANISRFMLFYEFGTTRAISSAGRAADS